MYMHYTCIIYIILLLHTYMYVHTLYMYYIHNWNCIWLCLQFTLTYIRVFDMFWSMGQISSTMVSVCVPLEIHQLTELILLATIINCAIWPKERTMQCQIRSSLGQRGAIMSLSKTWHTHVYHFRFSYMYMYIHTCTI